MSLALLTELGLGYDSLRLQYFAQHVLIDHGHHQGPNAGPTDQLSLARPKVTSGRVVKFTPRKRGGKKGPMNAKQRAEYGIARKEGVCIRCKFTQVKVSLVTARVLKGY